MAQMTNKEATKIYKGMKEYFGDKLANCDHHPRMFHAQMKMYKHILNLRAEKAEQEKQEAKVQELADGKN